MAQATDAGMNSIGWEENQGGVSMNFNQTKPPFDNKKAREAVSKAVASRCTAWARARVEIFICPSGSPRSAGTPMRLCTTSATPGILAQPPHSRIFSGCSRPEPEAR